jgi:DNA repair protein RadA
MDKNEGCNRCPARIEGRRKLLGGAVASLPLRLANIRTMELLPTVRKGEARTGENMKKAVGAIKEIQDISGIGEGVIKKLSSVGLVTLAQIANSNPRRLQEIEGIGEETAFKLITSAREAMGLDDFLNGLDIARDEEKICRISTGSKELDNLLLSPSLQGKMMGGVESMLITEAYGKFSSGKCVHKDTIIGYYDNSYYQIDNIGSLYSKLSDQYGEQPHEDGFTVSVPFGRLCVSSYNHDVVGITRESVSHMYKEFYSKLMQINTKRGRIIKTTPHHKFMVLTEEGLTWKRMGEINIGDVIAYPKMQQTEHGQTELSEDDAYFLGFFIAEGTPNPFSITNSEKTVVDWIENYVKNKYSFSPTIRKKLKIKETHLDAYIVCLRNPARAGLFGVDRCNSDTKFIPSIIFNSEDSIKKAFLAGYMEGDGCLNSKHIEFTSKSQRLITDLAYLLSTLGVSVTVKPHTVNMNNKNLLYYRASICGVDKKFFESSLPYKFKSYKTTDLRHTEHGVPKVAMNIIRSVYQNSIGGCRGSCKKWGGNGKRNLVGEESTLYGLFTGSGLGDRKVITHELMEQTISFFEFKLKQLEYQLRVVTNLQSLNREEQKQFFRELTFPFTTVLENGGVPKSMTRNYMLRGINNKYMKKPKQILIEKIKTQMETLRAGVIKLIPINSLEWDFVEEKTEFDYDDYVYDFVVPTTHNFIGGNLPTIMHNSQIGFELAINVQLPKEKGGLDGSAIYFDTENTFRSTRIKEICDARELDADKILQNIYVARVVSTDHLLNLLIKAEEYVRTKNVKLIVVDSLIAPFRREYRGREELPKRQGALNDVLMSLQNISNLYNVPIYVTNQVMDNPEGFAFMDPTLPVGGNVLAHATCRLYLMRKKDNRRLAKLVDSSCLPQGEVLFQITNKGIEDVE